MLIKQAEDRGADVAVLTSLLGHPDATSSVKEKIRLELRLIQSGIKGEDDAAHEINFYYEASKNWAIIHDLRLEHGKRSAQIDHLLINRFLDIWVCESKRFSEGIAINEHGEFEMFYEGGPRGIGSPLEQNKKHVAVLAALAEEGVIELPKRAGFFIKPQLFSLILVSKNARISRPEKQFDGLDSILKVDQMKSRIDREIDNDKGVLNIAKVIGSDTLKEFAERLAALHKPIAFDWHGRFGLARKHVSSRKKIPADDQPKTNKIGFIPCAGSVCPTCTQGKLERRSVKRADGTETDFLSCSRYPAYCKTIFPLVALTRQNQAEMVEAKPSSVPAPNHEGDPCPKCKTGHLVRRSGKGGKPPFLGCSGYSKTKCGFMKSIE